MIMFAVIAAIIVALPLALYETSNAPVPIKVKDGSSSYLWRYPFGTARNSPIFLNSTNSVAVITTKGFGNSSLAISITGYEFAGEGGPNFVLYLSVSGNLSANLHPKSLVVSQTTSFSSDLNTSDLPYPTDTTTWMCPGGSPSGENLTNLSVPASECGFRPQIVLKGTTSYSYNFVNDIGLSPSDIYHFGVAPNYSRNWNASPSSLAKISGIYCFYPSSYNLTYYTYFTASITGLSQPVYAQIELILERD
ncbi:MAG: hypothetical protein M1113_05800 [Candidatus Thermoplasmatota archaeon]|nr:hypothetical protein [Candidatus Thermoplasmatota archaeon]